MPFQEIINGSSSSRFRTSPDHVYMAVYCDKNNRLELAIRIGANIGKMMGLEQWPRLGVMEGSGVDAGVFQLQPNDSGVKVVKEGGNYVVRIHFARLRNHKPLEPHAFPQMEVPFARMGSVLTVTVPSFVVSV